MWLHNGSDIAIWLAYLAIPAVLVFYVSRRRDTPYHWMFWLFGAFIVLCGFTHFLEFYTFRDPIYRFSGTVKLLTAIVSWATVAALVPVTPKALLLPSTARLAVELEREVAERKAAEQRLAERARDLERSNADLEQFAYIASHDLQEPLRVVAGYMELLSDRNGHQLDEQGRQFVRVAADNAKRMQLLLRELLEYSRLSTGDVRRVPVDTDAVLRDVLTQLERRILDTDARVGFGPLPPVLADPVQLNQLLQNLVSNALKFTRPGERPRVDISGERDGDQVVLRVRDEGIGLDRAYAGKVFQIFQRLHGREQYPGAGVGLAVAKRIVERHGGTIGFGPNDGPGTTFEVRLSAAPAAASPAKA